MSTANLNLSTQALVRLVGQLTGAYPNPEDPDPVGPWGPVIRKALGRVRRVFGPSPDPWRWAYGPQPDPWTWAALNPQPLPPRYRVALALADAFVEQVGALEQLSGAVPDAPGHAKGLIRRFIDDCGNGHVVIRIPKGGVGWPPGDDEPRPIGPEELVLVGARLAAAEAVHPDLAGAGLELAELGLSRM